VNAFRALADERRRQILQLLRSRDLTVGEIVERFDVTQPAISQHLKVLRAAGLVTQRREGTRRLYRARSDGLVDLQSFLADFFDARLGELKELAEAEETEGRRGGERN
jgi:DNA-binding transcriptional ArsR family regulator